MLIMHYLQGFFIRPTLFPSLCACAAVIQELRSLNPNNVNLGIRSEVSCPSLLEASGSHIAKGRHIILFFDYYILYNRPRFWNFHQRVICWVI
jgi:hypothetical protein